MPSAASDPDPSEDTAAEATTPSATTSEVPHQAQTNDGSEDPATETDKGDKAAAEDSASSAYQVVDLDAPVPDSIRNTRSERKFPAAFYDPITGEIMNDPVVNPAGDSFDKSTLLQMGGPVTFYENRALQAIIKYEVEMADQSFVGTLRRADAALKSERGRLMEKSVFGVEFRPLPEGFYCPITCDLMVDPVINPGGITYEREAIEQWIQANGKSPFTREALSITDLRENNALYKLIQMEKRRNLDSIHPSIRRWIDSAPETSRRERILDPSSEQFGQQNPTSSAPPAMDAATTNSSPPRPTVPSATNNNWPTSEEELREHRRRQRRAAGNLTFCIFVITVFILVANMGIGILILIVASIIFCATACIQADREDRHDTQLAQMQVAQAARTQTAGSRPTTVSTSAVRGWDESVEEV